MLSLSDSELVAVMEAARPIPPHERDEFRRDVAVELEKYEVIGPGIIGRVCSGTQREDINRPTGSRSRAGTSTCRGWGRQEPARRPHLPPPPRPNARRGRV